MTRCGFCAIIGAPNAGKSTLANALVGSKVAIVSPKVQTTRMIVKGVAMMGEGGSIPFMTMLGEKFPHAQFVVTGVLGPHSNAHGPNEFLHIPTGRRVSTVIAQVLADHHAQ